VIFLTLFSIKKFLLSLNVLGLQKEKKEAKPTFSLRKPLLEQQKHQNSEKNVIFVPLFCSFRCWAKGNTPPENYSLDV